MQWLAESLEDRRLKICQDEEGVAVAKRDVELGWVAAVDERGVEPAGAAAVDERGVEPAGAAAVVDERGVEPAGAAAVVKRDVEPAPDNSYPSMGLAESSPVWSFSS